MSARARAFHFKCRCMVATYKLTPRSFVISRILPRRTDLYLCKLSIPMLEWVASVFTDLICLTKHLAWIYLKLYQAYVHEQYASSFAV